MAVIGLDAKVRLVLLVARLKSQMEFKGESLNPDHIARQKADKLGLDPKKDFHAFYKIRSGIEEKIARILEE